MATMMELTANNNNNNNNNNVKRKGKRKRKRGKKIKYFSHYQFMLCVPHTIIITATTITKIKKKNKKEHASSLKNYDFFFKNKFYFLFFINFFDIYIFFSQNNYLRYCFKN